MVIYKILLFCLMPVLAIAFPVEDIVISQQHYQVPILLQKNDNPVLRIHLHNGSAGSLQLTEMVFSLAGTNNWKDIKQVSLYAAGADSGVRNLGSVEKIQLVGRAIP